LLRIYSILQHSLHGGTPVGILSTTAEIHMIRSMTGFARRESQGPWGTLTCEIRAVNHRYLEL
jgi:hypothetical protein